MHVFSMAQLIIVTVLAAAFSLPSAAASINREPLGPAGGDQFDVVISPDDANTIYISGAFRNPPQ